MPFVKLDCGILRSTLWFDQPVREVFLTALLMAEPKELVSQVVTYKLRSTEPDEFSVPPGWYGFVQAAGEAIVRFSGVDAKEGLAALERLAGPDHGSRTPDFEGRRMVRVEGGFIILNFQKYRDRDYTAADRQARWRQRQKQKNHAVTSASDAVTVTRVTQAEAEAEVEVKEESKREKRHFVPPTLEEVKTHITEKGYTFDAEAFIAYYEARGWKLGRGMMASWKAACVTWSKRESEPTNGKTPLSSSRALPSGDFRLPTGGFAAADRSWFDYKGTRFFQEKPGVYRDAEGYAPDGSHKQNVAYGPAAQAVADRILAPVPVKP